MSQLVRVHLLLAALDLQRLRQVHDEAEVVEGVLVNGPHTVVDQQRTDKQSKQEYFGVVILLFVEGAKTLSVHNNDWQLALLIFVTVEDALPDPEAFGARVDGWADLEPLDGVRLLDRGRRRFLGLDRLQE